MNIAFIILMAVILIVLILVSVGFWLLRKSLDKGIPPNSTIVHKFGTKETHGHAILVLKDRSMSQTGNSVIYTGKALDIPYDKKGRPIFKSEDESFVTRSEFVVNLPAGTNSLHRNEMLVFPQSAAELTPEFRNDPWGSIIAFGINEMSFKDKAISMIKNRLATEKEAIALFESEQNIRLEAWKDTFKNLIKKEVINTAEQQQHQNKS